MSRQKEIARRLLAWWDAGHAHYPWRQTSDPYAIWVAEVMLQQTQIATVLPYYDRWLARYPDVASLARAPLADVLKSWEGLGYYSRARNLHAASRLLMADYGGHLPETAAELIKLPGIGRYTAGAISSIAFGRAESVVDGNVIRVLSRLDDMGDDVTAAATVRALWRRADELLPADRPGAHNQALMELGQTVCLPAMPACHRCPLADLCLAHARGTQLERPVRPPRKRTPHYDVTAGVIWADDGRFLIAQRPLDGLLGGLWEFPGGKQEPGETLAQALAREIHEELAMEIEVGQRLTSVRHAYTHFRITLHAFHARHIGGQPQNLGVADHAWVRLEDLARYAFAVTDQKIIAALAGEGDRL
jgi:A/G-specific adenine glycosylase